MTSEFQIHHVNVNVDALGPAVAFYRDVIGLPLDATPDQGFPSQFFRLGATQQIHMNEMPDARGERGHFCIVVPDFMAVFRRAKAAGVIETETWGRVRMLPNGKMQMFVRDPSGNLIEIASAAGATIEPSLFADPLVEPKPGTFRMPPGTRGGHENV